MISTCFFFTQLLVDLFCARFVDRIGYRVCVVASEACAAAGLAVLPEILPDPFTGILCSIVLYAIGSGLIEVLCSPIVEACPFENKEATMSLLHSFYCWGAVRTSCIAFSQSGHGADQVYYVRLFCGDYVAGDDQPLLGEFPCRRDCHVCAAGYGRRPGREHRARHCGARHAICRGQYPYRHERWPGFPGYFVVDAIYPWQGKGTDRKVSSVNRLRTAILISAKVISLFGTNKVSAFSTAMPAFALLGFSVSANFFSLCLFAIPPGLEAGAIDTALNNYVSLHYSATHMSFLHCLYGIGVTVSPYILSLVINSDAGWRGGYRVAFVIQLCIATILLLTLSIWRKAHRQDSAEEEQAARTFPFREIAQIPGVRLMWCLFITSCAIECTCGGWGSTYLVEYRHMDAVTAARMVMLYYMGMALGRFLSGILAARLDSWQIIRIGQWILGIAIVILLLSVPPGISAAGLFLIGLGNGPMFPNFNYLTPQNFGADISQSVMGTQMAMSYIGIMLAPAICGVLGQFINMGIFPVYLLVFYVTMLVATRRVKNVLLPHNNQTKQ